MVIPDGLFQRVPLGLNRGIYVFGPLASKRTGTGHSMNAIAGVQVWIDQVAQQIHFHPPGRAKLVGSNRPVVIDIVLTTVMQAGKKIILNMVIDPEQSSLFHDSQAAGPMAGGFCQ